ncbi:hypothetical protein CPB83DRAFT_842352 [Crepidotus variabilis]|uniref:Histone deacetylase complex subunit SAP30 Sin3 binding domain-containing protein n=1 Tax=Crepidotus variabilis TaxID=179855 RepID=A0A9P6EVF4_9AGAR|nr:hypothetical protein CPB83DRAFT_842352 [Crepidotus variabilis]
MSASVAQSSSSRSRTQSRKKVNDDAPYMGPSGAIASTTATKRQAVDKADGEPRVKRKRVETVPATSSTNKKDAMDAEPRKSLVEFEKMPMAILQRYLIQYEVVPRVYPSPLQPDDPPSPWALADPQLMPPPPSSPALTPANRPRRESKDTRRRSSRLLEEEIRTRAPILADRVELQGSLATIVERHFRETTLINGREEVDMLAAFMCAVEKAKGSKTKGS